MCLCVCVCRSLLCWETDIETSWFVTCLKWRKNCTKTMQTFSQQKALQVATHLVNATKVCSLHIDRSIQIPYTILTDFNWKESADFVFLGGHRKCVSFQELWHCICSGFFVAMQFPCTISNKSDEFQSNFWYLYTVCDCKRSKWVL